MSHRIANYHLKLAWTDGMREVMRSSLPEYLRAEIESYLKELEELRERQENEDEEYNFSSDSLISEEQFLAYFNSDGYNELDPDICAHIFLTSLKGSSDITRELLEQLCSEYCLDLNDVLNGGI